VEIALNDWHRYITDKTAVKSDNKKETKTASPSFQNVQAGID